MNLHAMADKMAFYLFQKEIIAKDKVEEYSFGLELLNATIANGLLVIAVAFLLGVFWETLLLLIPFVLVRVHAGGFHAKSHKCFTRIKKYLEL